MVDPAPAAAGERPDAPVSRERGAVDVAGWSLGRWTLLVAPISLVLIVAGLVLALRLANTGAEPVDENWWLVAELVLGLAYVPSGALLLDRAGWRLLGTCFVVVGISALLDALATQYLGYVAAEGGVTHWPWFASLSRWAWVLGASVLVTLVALMLVPRLGQSRYAGALSAGASGAAIVAIALQLVPELTAPWPSMLGQNPFELGTADARHLADVLGNIGTATVGVVATLALVLLAVWCLSRRRLTDDLLPCWLLSGAGIAWLAVVPPTVGVIGRDLPAPDVVQPLLLLATVPLLAFGVLIELARAAPTALDRVSHRFLEWVLLASGITVLYTGLVAGLGRLVGGSGPTWLLVGATGLIAVLAEPARRRVRSVVDQLVYGSRDDPLALVRQVMDHVSAADDSDELLPSLASSLGAELRLDEVVIELAVPGGWETAAAFGSPVSHTRHQPLRHHGEVVGRLTVGWRDAPQLRPRDTAALDELASPLGLAVSWVRLASDLRRSSLALMSAREEERRRLRRDLHDGLGPNLTGVSLGLRAAIRQIERSGDRPLPAHDAPATGPAEAGPAGPGLLPLLQRLADEIDSSVEEVKRIVRDLRPSALDQLGLTAAVMEFAHRLDGVVQVHLELPRPDATLPAAVEVAIYRIVTEALTNVVRHAAATRCWLRIDAGEAVDIEVVDDGIGIRAGAPRGIGLTAMHERAAELGGTVTLSPNRPHGTRLHVRLPAALP